MARDIGIHGNLFGGLLMAWIDEAAASYATEYFYTPNLVKVHVGELTFKKQLKAGNHLRIYAEVDRLGSTSITLNVEVRKYSLYNADETVVCTTTITFVRIDDDGSPTPIGAKVRKNHEQKINAPVTQRINLHHKPVTEATRKISVRKLKGEGKVADWFRWSRA